MTMRVPQAGQEKIGVAVLGATGAVGQRFIQLLAGHPWFAVRELVASDRSVGKTYAERQTPPAYIVSTYWQERLDNLHEEEAKEGA